MNDVGDGDFRRFQVDFDARFEDGLNGGAGSRDSRSSDACDDFAGGSGFNDSHSGRRCSKVS